MSRKHLSRGPVFISPHAWFYEEEKGLKVYLEVLNNEGLAVSVRMCCIPWKRIRDALRRKDRKP